MGFTSRVQICRIRGWSAGSTETKKVAFHILQDLPKFAVSLALFILRTVTELPDEGKTEAHHHAQDQA